MNDITKAVVIIVAAGCICNVIQKAMDSYVECKKINASNSRK